MYFFVPSGYLYVAFMAKSHQAAISQLNLNTKMKFIDCVKQNNMPAALAKKSMEQQKLQKQHSQR